MITYLKLALIFLYLVLFSFQSKATLLSFDNEADFNLAIGGMNITTIDFEGVTSGDIIADGDAIQGVTFNYDLGGIQLMVEDFAGTTSGTNYLGTDDGGLFLGGDGFDMSFSSAQMAIGMYIIGAYDEIFADDITLTVAGESVSLSTGFPIDVGDGEAFFIGLVVDNIANAFTSVSLSSASFDQLFNIDDITFAATRQDPPNGIPEPSSLVLMLLALMMFTYRKRKQFNL
ncbi:PEP-CTERM sorting domain-containing protein [Litorilituus sediminis]|nr:PEP-CTERM sorting domain-containing protein [Litorilituus sediminis]